MKLVLALVVGFVFGLGLLISGMTDSANVVGFLDVTGEWRPALAFVMGAGVIVSAVIFAIARKRKAPLLEPAFETPGRTNIDFRLILGAAIFGIGWGLAGICPGPSIVLLGQAPAEIGLFIGAVIAGQSAAAGLERLTDKSTESVGVTGRA